MPGVGVRLEEDGRDVGKAEQHLGLRSESGELQPSQYPGSAESAPHRPDRREALIIKGPLQVVVPFIIGPGEIPEAPVCIGHEHRNEAECVA